MDASSSDDEDVAAYLLHNAAELGDVEAARALLDAEDGVQLTRLRDPDSCTPLHVALLHGHLDLVRLLLERNPGSLTSRCEGSPPLHVAACLGAFPVRRDFALQAAQLLVSHGAPVRERDDQGRTALHWAVASKHAALVELLLAAARDQAASAEAAAAVASEAEGILAENGSRPLPAGHSLMDTTPLATLQDKQGSSALHLAARHGANELLQLLLQGQASLLQVRNNDGQLPLHVAARSGCEETALALLKADPATARMGDRRGFRAAQLAARSGHQGLAGALAAAGAGELPDANGDAGEIPVGPTLLLAPEECHLHNTFALPIVRGGEEPPPENVNRLHVLTDPERGILRSAEFAELQWDTSSVRAGISDILRVHEWSYVRDLQNLCASLAAPSSVGVSPKADMDSAMPGNSRIGHLDGDTALSAGSFRAALAAAGAVMRAVDRVVGGEARNAFCAVRPPGHHAGPTGVVPCENDRHGSHGFCLLSNLAIGAAYAMTQYRDQGIRRVALLDFDVHHGNGTQACVGNTVPSLATYAFQTPLSSGSQVFPLYKPWRDFDDADHILFASVQGYGQSGGGWLYPGSGATSDTRPPVAPAVSHAVANGDAAGIDAAGAGMTAPTTNGVSSADEAEEDPEGEFTPLNQQPPSSNLRIINVGVSGPGHKVALWRRAWRDKILPAVVRHRPDLILISAGFDAHRKDGINQRFVGVQERDYEWLTGQIVQVANACCGGRVVSVLEGGYRIQGGPVSAFARSVAAHVRALAEPNMQVWDPADAKWERQYEMEQRVKAEAARQAAAQAEAAALEQRLAELAPAEGPAMQQKLSALAAAEAAEQQQAAAAEPHATGKGDTGAGASPGEAPDRKRRRRGAEVDYRALDEKLRAEEAAQPGPSSA